MRNIFVLALILLPVLGFAHPHIWVDAETSLVVNEQNKLEILVEWTFDKEFTKMILDDYDLNKNGKYEASEVKEIFGKAFSNVKNFNYFSRVFLNGKETKITTVSDFTASQTEKALLQYTFKIPIQNLDLTKTKNFSLGIMQYDEKYYLEVHYLPNQSKDNFGALKFEIKETKDKKYAYWGGTLIPTIRTYEFRN